MEDNRYPARDIIRWLWRAWRGNRLQAVLNATLGLLGVGVSLAQVWAVQHAIDVASHTIEGSLYIAVALMGGLVLCDFAINVSAIWVRNILGIRAQNRMQQSMLDRILRGMAWQGALPQRRRHQQARGGCKQRGGVPHGDNTKHSFRPRHVPRRVLLPVHNGLDAGNHHHCHAAGIHTREQGVHKEDAKTDTQGA